MRLIDADEVINILKETGIIQDNELGHCVIDEINRIPTAYDVDKVTHEINNKIQELDAKQQLFIENGLLNMADKMANKIGIYIECRGIVEKAGEEDVSTRNFI